MTEVTTVPAPIFSDSKEWFKSRAMIGSIVAVIAIVLGAVGFEFDGVLQGEVADKTYDAIGLGGTIYALVGRVLATKSLK